jgi:hypothetical protein
MSAVLRPSDVWASRLRVLLPRGQVSFLRVLNAVDAMDRLALVLQDAMSASTSSDGRCDFRAVAFEVLVEVVRNQRGLTIAPASPSTLTISDSMIATVANVIERAINRVQKQGVVDMKDLATRIYADVTRRGS